MHNIETEQCPVTCAHSQHKPSQRHVLHMMVIKMVAVAVNIPVNVAVIYMQKINTENKFTK